jgi:hypothetical protein
VPESNEWGQSKVLESIAMVTISSALALSSQLPSRQFLFIQGSCFPIKKKKKEE